MSTKKLPVDTINKRLQAEIELLQDSIKNLQKNKIVENQPLLSYFQANVNPLQLSNLKLSGGKTTPFYYSLGADSTVPFISLSGGGTNQKIITWGEIIKVEPGQTVTVKSESYMKGDIQINSGIDYNTKPQRISVPVVIEEVAPFSDGFNTYTFIKSVFPVDTRTAKRAFLNFTAKTVDMPILMFAVSQAKKHSFPSSPSAGSPFIQNVFGSNTYNSYTYKWVPPFSTGNIFNLGWSSIEAPDNNITALIDQIHIAIMVGFDAEVINRDPSVFDPNIGFLDPLLTYTLEY